MADHDYTPLDLSAGGNAGLDVLPENARYAVGRQTYRGIPFQIGPVAPDGPSEKPKLVRLAGGDTSVVLSVESGTRVGATARHILFLHRQLESQLPEGGPLGQIVACYTVCYADGSAEHL